MILITAIRIYLKSYYNYLFSSNHDPYPNIASLFYAQGFSIYAYLTESGINTDVNTKIVTKTKNKHQWMHTCFLVSISALIFGKIIWLSY